MIRTVVAIIVTWLLGIGAAAGVEPVDLPPLTHRQAALEVLGPEGVRRYAPTDIEALGAKRMTTITPWRDSPAAFEGALLSDLLADNGLADVRAIRVIAENDYSIEIPASVWQRWTILVATRVDGQPHSRRARGPIQFVLPMSDDPAAGTGSVLNYWVWMAARIEAVN